MQETNRVFWTHKFRFRKILEILGIVVWEQVLEGWHLLDDRDLDPPLLQNSDRCICKRLEVRCDYNMFASRLINEVGDSRRGIPRRNREGGTLGANNPELGGGIGDCVYTLIHRMSARQNGRTRQNVYSVHQNWPT